MDYKIVQKPAFGVLGNSKHFTYENAKSAIPEFWDEHYSRGFGQYICGEYGVCIDTPNGSDGFEYLIADDYTEGKKTAPGLKVLEIPAFTWAVFPCKGALPQALQSITGKIYSEWLPNNAQYEIAAGYSVEFYDAPANYANGTKDENYYCEIWIPVKNK